MQVMQKLNEAWEKVPQAWKSELVSAWHTFVAAFMAEIALNWHVIEQGEISGSVISAILFAALRSGVKAVFMWLYELTSKPAKPFTPKKKSKD